MPPPKPRPASGMSSTSSPGAVSRVVGYSTTDPTTTFVRGIHTLKNGSYYKRNWASGNPYSSVPVWLDMDHCPPQQREFIVRPDLALTAMQRILGRIEQASRPHPLHRIFSPADRPGLLRTDRSSLSALNRSPLLACLRRRSSASSLGARRYRTRGKSGWPASGSATCSGTTHSRTSVCGSRRACRRTSTKRVWCGCIGVRPPRAAWSRGSTSSRVQPRKTEQMRPSTRRRALPLPPTRPLASGGCPRRLRWISWRRSRRWARSACSRRRRAQ